jgi:type I restriction enzyme S subunit
MMSESGPELRSYSRADCAVFRRTKERHGGLSNMAGGFPLVVAGAPIRTSEALYQACRFPHDPGLQAAIIAERSPMAAKMRGKPFRDQSRADWDDIRVSVMRWCIRVKLLQNFARFSNALLETGEDPIVEESRRDRFWGAVPAGADRLEGQNILGRLLMELREEVRSVGDRERPLTLPAPDVGSFLLLGEAIGEIIESEVGQSAGVKDKEGAESPAQHRLF